TGSATDGGQLLLTLGGTRKGECSSTADGSNGGHRTWDIGHGQKGEVPCPMSYVLCPQSKHWDQSPLALTDGSATRPRLRAVTAAAAREGIRAGMSHAEARALCARLETQPWDDLVVDAAIAETTARLVQAS